MVMAKKAVKKATKKSTPVALHTIVVGKKKRNDVFAEVRIPTALVDTLKCLSKNGEVRISENQFYEAMHKVSVTGPAISVDLRSNEHLNFGGFVSELPLKTISNMAEEAKAKSILMEAQDLVFGDREATYGTPDVNLRSIANFWTVYLDRKRAIQGPCAITVEDVSQMMILMKSARLIHRPDHRDSLVDQAGYAALQQRIHDERPF
jgi:hypothetical protein